MYEHLSMRRWWCWCGYVPITRVQFVSAAYDLYVNLKSDAKNTQKKKTLRDI